MGLLNLFGGDSSSSSAATTTTTNTTTKTGTSTTGNYGAGNANSLTLTDTGAVNVVSGDYRSFDLLTKTLQDSFSALTLQASENYADLTGLSTAAIQSAKDVTSKATDAIGNAYAVSSGKATDINLPLILGVAAFSIFTVSFFGRSKKT